MTIGDERAPTRVGIPMGPRAVKVTIYTDASLQGWGTVIGQNTAHGQWPRGPLAHLNALEMIAVWHALQKFAPFLAGSHILIMTDNMTTKAYINHQGGTISGACMRRIWLWVAENALSIRA